MPQVNLTKDQQNALELKKHITLTANAGSGKSFVLTQRFLEILLKTNTSLKQIAAITFTEKAAGELYGKISKSILEASIKNEDDVVRKKYERLRKQLVSANISTIHSFCAQILREFPVEAEIDANFSPIDASLSEELINLSLNEVIKSFEKNEEKNILLQWLIRIFGSLQVLAHQLTTAINHRNALLNFSKSIYAKDINLISDFFTEKLEYYISQIFLLQVDSIVFSIKRINNFALKKNSALAEDVQKLLEQLDGKTGAIEVFDLFHQIKDSLSTKDKTIKKNTYLGNKAPSELLEDIAAVEKFFITIGDFEHFSNYNLLHTKLATFGKNFLLMFNAVLRSYENKKSDLGYLDFEDILIKTKNVLELPNVRQKLSQRYRYLMVDEYQDTNEIQYEIFLPILERLKSGNLFVVGDEKQSIYKFRDAELSVFSKTKKDVSNEEGLALLLPASFRMSPILCAFTNYLFRNLFIDANPLYNEVAHTDLVCAKNEELNGEIEILLSEEDKNGNFISEAELVVRKIIFLTSSGKTGIKFSDIAILCRKRSSFETLERAFQKYDLPYAIWEGKGFYQQQIIYDFYNYISFLSNDSDDAALVGILRSPFFFFSDTDILSISLNSGKNLWAKLNSFSKKNLKISSAVSLLLKHKNFLQSIDMVTLLRMISEDTSYLAIISARRQGVKEIANFEKLIQLTRNFFKHGFRNAYDYLSYLKEAIADSTEEGQAHVSDNEETIKVMTVHQAKGLEFKTVFIFECNKEGVDAKIKAKEVQINKEFGLMAKLPVEHNFCSKYLSPPIVDLHNYLETKKESAELKRLLYVAITRAKNHLYFSATIKPKPNLRSKNFLSLLSLGLNSDFTESELTKSVNLVYLRQQNNTETNVTEPTEFTVSIVKDISAEPNYLSAVKTSSQEPNINLAKIADIQKEEIISATKVAIYNQCPTKYLLTYEFGYHKLYDAYKNYHAMQKNNHLQFEFSDSENDVSAQELFRSATSPTLFPPEIKGKLIHTILEKNLALDEIRNFINNYLAPTKLPFTQEQLTGFIEPIIDELANFYASDTCRILQNAPDFQNEFQVYLKEKDFYLFGIIDKVIFSETDITIIDYKTDNIAIEDTSTRAQGYYFQLTFYAFILKKLFPKQQNIQLQIIFTKFPNATFIHKLHENELQKLESFLDEMVTKIRRGSFSKNLTHCRQCHFVNRRNNCIF